MARPSPSPHVLGARYTSPLAPSLDATVAISDHSRSSPVTPTPRRFIGGEHMRSPISALEFNTKKTSRNDDIFLRYKQALKTATTLVTFEWDAENSQGKLVPIP